MKQFIALIALLGLFIIGLNAQEVANKDTTYWKHDGFAQLTFNQASFKNWAAGGQNSIAFTITSNYTANYLKGKHAWETKFDANYGLLKYKREPFRKSDDLLEVQSKYGYDIVKEKLYWSSLFNFKTQFTDGFNYPDDSTVISSIMAPGYLTLSTGLDYKPCDHLTIYFSPITGKFTFVTNQVLANQGAFGVDAAVTDANGNIVTEGKNSRAELGAYLTVGFKKDIVKNVNLDTKGEFFMNYSEKEKELRGNIDVNWVTTVSMKINDYLTTSLILHLIYDHDIDIALLDDDGNQKYSQREDGSFFLDAKGNKIPMKGPRTQFKQVFGLGLSYKFSKPDKKE